MKHLPAAHRKAAAAVGHHALALGDADGLAQIGLAAQAVFALPAFRVYSGITWSPFFRLVTPGPMSTTTPAPSWPRIAGTALGIGARAGEFIGMADAGGPDFDQHLAGARAARSTVSMVSGRRSIRDGGFDFHC